jgi:hypothetical protein
MKILKLSTQKQQSTDEDEKKVKRNYAAAFYDVMALLGFISIGYGLHLIYPPAMYIVIGIMTMGIASIFARE